MYKYFKILKNQISCSFINVDGIDMMQRWTAYCLILSATRFLCIFFYSFCWNVGVMLNFRYFTIDVTDKGKYISLNLLIHQPQNSLK